MGTLYGFKKSQPSPRRSLCDAERRTAKGIPKNKT